MKTPITHLFLDGQAIALTCFGEYSVFLTGCFLFRLLGKAGAVQPVFLYFKAARKSPPLAKRSISECGPILYLSSTSRTFQARALGVNGFCRKATSASRMPCRTTASSV